MSPPCAHFYELVSHIWPGEVYHIRKRVRRNSVLTTVVTGPSGERGYARFRHYIGSGSQRDSTHPTSRALRPLLPTAPCCLTSDTALAPFSLAPRGYARLRLGQLPSLRLPPHLRTGIAICYASILIRVRLTTSSPFVFFVWSSSWWYRRCKVWIKT